MRAERPIVSRPDRQTLGQRVTSGSLVAVAVGIWTLLWLPIASAILWTLGVHITYKSIVRAPNQSSLLIVLLLVFMCNMIVSSWASYNYIRFVGKSRRRGSGVISHETVGKFFGVEDPEMLALLLTERRINLYFDNAAGLSHADICDVESSEKPVTETSVV